MKCIDTTKKYLNENKNGIVYAVSGLAMFAGALCVGTIGGILYEDLKWKYKLKDKYIANQDVAYEYRHAIGDYDYMLHTMGINRDKDPAFNEMLEQAATSGVVTGDKGITRKVVGVLIYGGERVNED